MEEKLFSGESATLTTEQISRLKKSSIWVALVSWLLGMLMAVWNTSPLTLYRDFANAGIDNPWMLPSAAVSMVAISGFWLLVVYLWLANRKPRSLYELSGQIRKTVFWTGTFLFACFAFVAISSLGFMGNLSFGLFGFLLTTPMNLFPLIGFRVAKKVARVIR
jgi:hypothetical protein